MFYIIATRNVRQHLTGDREEEEEEAQEDSPLELERIR